MSDYCARSLRQGLDSTPHFSVGANLYNVDLFLDVLVGSDGRQHVVQDEDDFAGAINSGWLAEAEQSGARSGLAELLDIVESAGLLTFLEGICPFDHMTDCDAPRPMIRRPLAGVRLLHQHTRYQYFGQRLLAGQV